ncbi:hypothetical protein Tco_0801996 [Tanacetum coccineum]|uniref:Uncharacterized protein n=1 Tax=Tanacetum coccineum TaxID=301880 RepID=A0ABQ5A1T8_9ASTR
MDGVFIPPIHKYAKLTTLVPTYGAPPLSTPIIDLSPPKPISTSTPEPIFTATTVTTTTTLPLPPPPQQQSSSDTDLASRVSALEQVCANFEKRHKIQDNTVQGLSSRVFTLELRDLPHKIDETINEAVKEVVQIVLQAPLKERVRDVFEADMKEILHDRMFESGTYRSQSEHVALYEALEASMERDNRDEFLAKKDNSSKQKSIPHSEQLVKEVPIVDDANISDSEDTDTAHFPKIKTRPDWLKPAPEEDIPKTLEPDWIGKSKLSKADLEGPAYKVGRALHSNIISLQFQMEECHLLLTDKIDLVNPEGNRLVPNVGKPLPLGGPPGHVIIQPQFFFNKDLEYLISSSQEKRNALSISKLKAAYYPDFGLEELIPSLWIKSEQEYDISAAYCIIHWWVKRKEFYITRHSAPSDRRVVRSHMQILSVISLKTYERYGYTFLKEIVVRRSDYNEYKI